MVPENVTLILMAMGGFALVHSLTAGVHVKHRLSALVGERLVEGWYRFAYNLLSVLSLVPALYLTYSLPDRVLFTARSPYFFVLLALQAVGALGFLWGMLSVDLLRFAGIRQALAYLQGETLPLTEEPLQERGVYGFVRHPLYLFALLMIWLIPVITLNILAFNVGATLYLVGGSLIEEQRLLRVYGEVYSRYRQRVPWLIPRPFAKHR